ncbi:cytochrome c551/c552/glucose/arabinose dehydrogenase [Flavobacterium sp. W4I14]|nr:cytochrome c551/c552/glucose/arabinose dehydrogenase [Flavobacterium sp. W4I14]
MNIFFNYKNGISCLLTMTFILMSISCFAQAESPKEDDYFKIMKVPAPEGAILEVGGLCTLPNGDLGVTTRRGDVFIVKNPSSSKPTFQKFASGLHEVLGLAYKNGSFYCVQRGELTKMTDTDNDGVADDFETIYAWPLSGNYHEYSFGPKLAADGSFFVTLNLGFPPTWWNPTSMVPWRGWALHIFEDGRVEPWAAGMRSPCGISMIDDQLFYTDNQGDWVGSGSIMQVKKGAFMGHPASLVWANLPQSPIKLTTEQFFAKNETKMIYDSKGNSVKPENDVNAKVVTEMDMKKNFPELQIPAVWLPHGILGISNSEIVKIPQGSFGPFAGQLLVGDQGQSMVSRVFMEKINGEYQGAAWPFRSGFQSGIVRLAWGKDGSLFAGETNRGWGSAGEATEGIQRLVWNNKIPFEMRSIKAMPDGFEIAFTKPVDKKYALDLASYSVESFIYKYHSVYGSPPVNSQKCNVKGVRVSADGLTARIIVAGLRKGYIHNITLDGIRSQENYYSLVHPTAYYTLNNIPEGKALSLAEVSTKNSASTKKLPLAQSKKSSSGGKTSVVKIPTYEQVKGLLTKNTCLACHNSDKRQVGPSFKEISTKKYTVEELTSLIYTPKPEHWPGYSTPMPPMTNVPKDEVKKIASWIKSLNK